jgi:hypothetical protein
VKENLVQVFELEPDLFTVVDTLDGDEMVTIPDREVAEGLADYANLYYERRQADRIKALKMRAAQTAQTEAQGNAQTNSLRSHQ